MKLIRRDHMPQNISIRDFSDYPLEEIFTDPKPLLPYLSAIKYLAGEVMLCNFYNDKKIYIITEGRFNLYYYQSTGEQLFIRTCNAVILAGEMELVKRCWPDIMEPDIKDYYFEMLTDCCMLVLNYSKVTDILMNDSRFLNYVCRSVVEKFSHFSNMEISSNMDSSIARVAECIINSADPAGIWKRNQKLVAEELRLSYRHLHRVLKNLIDDGCITRITGGYQIKDPEKLRSHMN